jgi:5,5'-dehydrodivanillate O-demethylase
MRLPTTIQLNQPWPGGKFDWPRYSAIFRTPVDDLHTLLFHVTFVPEVDGKPPVLPPGMEYPACNLVQTLFLQDYRAVVSQGRPVDRTVEKLGTTDRGVTMLRKMIRAGIAAVQEGRDPPGVHRDPARDVMLDSAAVVTDGLMTVQAAE